MGNQNHVTSYSVPEGEESKGGFGKVWKVKDKKYKIEFALKEMAKVKVIDKKSEKSIKAEREFLQKLKHPFIVNMHSAFQDYEHLYLVMDLLNGGDLRYHLSKKRHFTEEQTKFFIACIIVGLEYIHSKNILHRDIKPENLVLDESGYIHITDFGVAKYYNLNNSHETSGTPGYMSPEVMRCQNHSYSVDFYAVGVIAYEFMTGKRPYLGKSRKEIKEQIMASQVEIKQSTLPEGWGKESVDFINQLIQRKQENRLGHKSIKEIFDHPWFSSFPFKRLLNKQLDSPYIPEKKDNFDKKYCEGMEKIGLETCNRYDKIFENSNFTSLFDKFTYYGRDNDSEYSSSTNKKTNYYVSFVNKTNSISLSANNNKKRCQSSNVNVNDIKIIDTFTSGFYCNKKNYQPKEITKKSIGQANKKANNNKIPCPSNSTHHSSNHNSMNFNHLNSFKQPSAAATNQHDGSKVIINEGKSTGVIKTIRKNRETIMLHSRGGSVISASSSSAKSQNNNTSFQRSSSNLGENTRGATIVTRNTHNSISNALSANTPNHSINNNNTNANTNTHANANSKITKRNKIAFTSVTSLSTNSLNNQNSSTIVNAHGGTHANNYSIATNTINSNNNNLTKPYTKKQAISKSPHSFLTIKINSVTSPTNKNKGIS